MRVFSSFCAVLLSGAWLSACSSSDNDGGMVQFTDGGVEGDGGTELPAINFARETIDGVGVGEPTVGDNATLVLSAQGVPTIAYGVVPLTSTKYEVWYAERGGDGTWAAERAVVPGNAEPMASGQIIGLGLAHVNGAPKLAYIGGDGDGRATSPFPTDLMLATKNGASWTEQTIADLSADATGDCPGTQNTCNVGNVVGSHAAIAANPSGNGFTVVYRDTHGGFARNDLSLSDVETYSEGGAPMRACVDPVRSGGGFANVVYTMSGNPVLAYNIESPGPTGSPPRVGVWTAAYDGAMWNLVKVSDSQAASKISLARAAGGTLWMAFNHSDDIDLIVAHSDDGGLTWMSEIVDSGGKTGLHPGIAVDNDGRPVVAFAYCGRQSDAECPGSLGARSEVRLARLEGGVWKLYLVDDGQGFGHVGLFNSVVVTSDGKLGIAFVDEENGDLLYAREM